MKSLVYPMAWAVSLVSLPLPAAESIGGQNEKPTVVTGEIVDLLCEVARRCTQTCTQGTRLLGVKLADGKLLAVPKGPADFAGPQVDLAPHCGKTITMDGLLFENPKMPIFQVQGIKTDPNAAAFTPADRFLPAWTAKNGAAEEWFRADPAISAQIGRTGPLGRADLKPKSP